MDPATDFVFYKNGKGVFSGGYKINNIFKKMGVSPIIQTGGNLVVPAGLFFLQQNLSSKESSETKTALSDDIHNQLLQLSIKKSKKSKTRSRRSKSKKKTRRRS